MKRAEHLPTVVQQQDPNLNKTKQKNFKVCKGRPLLSDLKTHQPNFNDPLYQYLDNQVFYHKDQHHFGPWVQPQLDKPKQRIENQVVNRQLPSINQIRARYMEGLTSEVETGLPALRVRPSRIVSLAEIKHSSLQLQTQLVPSLKKPKKSPSFLKVKGGKQSIIRSSSEVHLLKSNFIYNYGLRQAQSRGKEGKLKVKQGYLKLGRENNDMGMSSNARILEQLRLYRLSKVN